MFSKKHGSSKTLVSRDNRHEPIIVVPNYMLEKVNESAQLTKWTDEHKHVNVINEADGKTYEHIRELTAVVSSSVLFFDVRRELPNVHDHTLYPSETIYIRNGDILKLFAIVCHVSMHYTCFIVDPESDTWYAYDDMSSTRLRKLGTFKTMLSLNKKLCTNKSTVLMYCRPFGIAQECKRHQNKRSRRIKGSYHDPLTAQM